MLRSNECSSRIEGMSITAEAPTPTTGMMGARLRMLHRSIDRIAPGLDAPGGTTSRDVAEVERLQELEADGPVREPNAESHVRYQTAIARQQALYDTVIPTCLLYTSDAADE